MDCRHLHLYRHRDSIALQGHGLPTVYLNAAMCHMLSKALADGTVDLLTRQKAESHFDETHLQLSEPGV